MSTPMLCQWDKRWRLTKMGGGLILGDHGCLLTTWADIVTDLTGESLDPVAILTKAKAAGAITAGGLPYQVQLALVLKCAAPELVRSPPQPFDLMRQTIVDALASGGRAILHVDHDSAKAKGDFDGDHFCSARRIEGDVLVIGDPDGGEERRLDLQTLSGPGAGTKTYIVRSARPVRRLPQ